MAKFVVVKEEPKNLKVGEIVISMPDFIEEIEASERFASKLGKRRLTSLFHLKNIAGNIGRAYDPEEFNPISSIPYSRYEGIEFESAKDLSEKVVLRMFNKHHPQIVDKYLDKKIKTRPKDTKLIYFVGSNNHLTPFLENGIDQENSKKKVVNNN